VDRLRASVTMHPDGWSPASIRADHRIRLTGQLVRYKLLDSELRTRSRR